MSRFLVTGAAGFVGSHIAERLLKEGHEVVGYDNLSLGSMENLKDKNLKFIRGDLRDYCLLDMHMRDVDVVIHQGAASSTPMFKYDWKNSFETNVMGFANVLDSARKNDVKRVVFASTSNIYCGIFSNHPFTEGELGELPNFYETTKFMNEMMAERFSKEFGIQTIGLRYLSIYGKNERAKGKFANLVSQFIWDIAKDKEIEIYSKKVDGGYVSALRDFVYYEDVANANYLASTEEFPNNLPKIFNVATGKSTSISELALMIGQQMGKTPKIKFVDAPANYVWGGYASTLLADDILNFRTKWTLEEGIKELVSYYGEKK